jgi:hypothetical protein
MFRHLLAIFRRNIQLIAGSYCIYNGSVVLCALVLLGSIYNIFGKFCRSQLNVCVCVCVCRLDVAVANIYINKHLKKLLRGTALLITLIKHATGCRTQK